MQRDACGDVEALGVDGYGHELRARRGERRPRTWAARLFDPDGIAGIEEHARRQIQRLLRPGDNHDSPRVAPHAPRNGQVARSPAQRAVAGRVAVSQQVGRRVAPAARDVSRPLLEREPSNAGMPGRERTRRAGSCERHRRADQRRTAVRDAALARCRLEAGGGDGCARNAPSGSVRETKVPAPTRPSVASASSCSKADITVLRERQAPPPSSASTPAACLAPSAREHGTAGARRTVGDAAASPWPGQARRTASAVPTETAMVTLTDWHCHVRPIWRCP